MTVYLIMCTDYNLDHEERYPKPVLALEYESVAKNVVSSLNYYYSAENNTIVEDGLTKIKFHREYEVQEISLFK